MQSLLDARSLRLCVGFGEKRQQQIVQIYMDVFKYIVVVIQYCKSHLYCVEDTKPYREFVSKLYSLIFFLLVPATRGSHHV